MDQNSPISCLATPAKNDQTGFSNEIGQTHKLTELIYLVKVINWPWNGQNTQTTWIGVAAYNDRNC